METTKGVVVQTICKEVLQSSEGFTWFQQTMEKIGDDTTKPSQFYLSFSRAPRKLSKGPLQLSEEQVNTFKRINPGFILDGWTIDELCRIAFMTQLPVQTNQTVLEKLFSTADLRESVALYKGVYYLDNASDFIQRVIEGLRTNIQQVFDAIALDNPFPLTYFAELPWNQMVLKALFMERPIYRIFGLDERSNATLATILQDYAHERWSAGRSVSPELWRGVVGYLNASILSDVKRVLGAGQELEKFAAARVLLDSGVEEGAQLIANYGLSTESLPSWDEIGVAVNRV
ncbi:MAG: EboA domain-containing protein [Bacteroidota bacterium]